MHRSENDDTKPHPVDDTYLSATMNSLNYIKSSEPTLVLKWLYLVQSLGIHDAEWWQTQYISKSRNVLSEESSSLQWKDGVIQKGSLLLYCDIMCQVLKVSHFI